MKAAVLERLNTALAIHDIDLPYAHELASPVGYGQVLVRVLVAGICGAQLQEIRGDKGDPAHLPHLLGHEGCGIVEQIGAGVKRVKPGDKVVMHWRKGDGCDVGGVEYSPPAAPAARDPEDTEFLKRHSPSCLRDLGHSRPGGRAVNIKSGPVTCFSEYSIVSENRVTPVPQDFPDDLACLLGCSLSTALGVIENEARCAFGESVMIVGCGGVGLALILAARLAHAYPIIAVDKSMDKLEMVQDLGADYFAEDFADPDIQDVDVVIDTTGNFNAISGASLQLKDSGRMILVGQPQPGIHLVFPNGSHLWHGTGKSISATQGGCFSPSTDIPRYINLRRSGALDGWENLITHRVSLDDINQGIDLVREGKAGRVLVDMNNLSGGLSGGNEVADVIQSQPLAHSLTIT